MKILYIEDNPVDIDLTLRQFKKSEGSYEFTIARSQEEALNLLKSTDPTVLDLVLIDMHLQDGDGIAILTHIRAHSLPVAVVILTGQGDEAAAVAAFKAGTDDYVVKKKGYLDRLPAHLDAALASHFKTDDEAVRSLKVLFVEHSPTDIDLTLRHFQKHAPHIQLEVIQNVPDFYEMIENSNLSEYSALLLDYRLPQENALELMQKLNISPQTRISVILITGKGDEELAVEALKCGAFDYVTKNHGYLYKLPSIIENAYYSIRLEREHELLLESEKRYRTLFEDSHVSMLLIDPTDGRIIDANIAASNFYGWSNQELKNKYIKDINRFNEDEARVKMSALLDQKTHRFSVEHIRADGSVCDVEVYSGPIELDGKQLLYSMVYDITNRIRIQKEKEKLQEKLIQSQKMESFGQLAGGIAHDFNNILSSIIGFTELAMDQVEDNSSLGQDLQEVYSSGMRAKELVDQILAFARQSDQKLNPVRIDHIAQEVLKLIRSSTPSNIEIKQSYNSTSCIMGNTIQIHQVMMNLCTNSTHAMEENGGVLDIQLSDVDIHGDEKDSEEALPPGKYIQLIVSDNGDGIPEHILNNIFEPYFTTKSVGKGTGMGLAMVLGIVESHGGKIKVESEITKGTTFTICLPVSNECENYSPQIEEKVQPGAERILFVDDEEQITKIGVRSLGQLGYIVVVKNSSTSALELFAREPESFDLVITDMTMPVMTGDKLALAMMKIRPDIPIIICSGYSSRLSANSAAEIGVKSIISKPFSQEKLAQTVRKVLDNIR